MSVSFKTFKHSFAEQNITTECKPSDILDPGYNLTVNFENQKFKAFTRFSRKGEIKSQELTTPDITVLLSYKNNLLSSYKITAANKHCGEETEASEGPKNRTILKTFPDDTKTDRLLHNLGHNKNVKIANNGLSVSLHSHDENGNDFLFKTSLGTNSYNILQSVKNQNTEEGAKNKKQRNILKLYANRGVTTHQVKKSSDVDVRSEDPNTPQRMTSKKFRNQIN